MHLRETALRMECRRGRATAPPVFRALSSPSITPDGPDLRNVTRDRCRLLRHSPARPLGAGMLSETICRSTTASACDCRARDLGQSEKARRNNFPGVRVRGRRANPSQAKRRSRIVSMAFPHRGGEGGIEPRSRYPPIRCRTDAQRSLCSAGPRRRRNRVRRQGVPWQVASLSGPSARPARRACFRTRDRGAPPS
jgi:hypothetical protein